MDGAETQKSKIDPKKPLQYAVDREKEGLSKYKEGLLKFVATKEGYVLDKTFENKVHPIACRIRRNGGARLRRCSFLTQFRRRQAPAGAVPV